MLFFDLRVVAKCYIHHVAIQFVVIRIEKVLQAKEKRLEGLGHMIGGIVGGLLTEVVVQLIADRIKTVLNQDPKCPMCNKKLNVNIVGNFYCNHCVLMQ